MRNPVKALRRTVQVLALLAFLFLFWQTRWHGQALSSPPPFFLRLDPLAALTAWLAPTPIWLPLFVPAALTLLVTVLLGRVFCGWICPLGTTLDLSDHLLWRKRSPRPELNRPAWKYYLLAAALASAVFGAQLGWLLDPIPLLTRTLTVVAYPLSVAAYNLGVTVGHPVLQAVGLSAYPTDREPVFALNLAVLAVFVVILGLGAFSRRYWCRSLCPLGALLGLVGRFSLLGRKVDGCVSCKRCRDECKMGAIPVPQDECEDYRRTVAAECVQCFDCLVCPQEGISRLGFSTRSGDVDEKTHLGKRRFIGALGLGLLYGATAATGAGRHATHSRLLRPPGAILRTPSGPRNMSESEFRSLCVRCGNCMKACVTGGLQPAVVEAGFDGLFTPILIPKLGHCEQNCTACGQVCPTGALGQFRVEEKKQIQIGLATIHTDKCLCWRKGDLYRLCLVCDEQCSYDAVKVIEYEGQKRPVVDAGKCVGCGICENKCPCKPEAAIVVYRRDTRV